MLRLSNARRRALRRDTAGQSLVEFALVLPVLLLLFFGIFEFGRFYFTRLTLQHAVREATRFAVTGQTLDDDETGDPLDRPNSIIKVIREKSSNLNVDVASITITPADGGGSEDVVRVAVDFAYQMQLPFVKDIVPDGEVHLKFSTAMRNEIFYD